MQLCLELVRRSLHNAGESMQQPKLSATLRPRYLRGKARYTAQVHLSMRSGNQHDINCFRHFIVLEI